MNEHKGLMCVIDRMDRIVVGIDAGWKHMGRRSRCHCMAVVHMSRHIVDRRCLRDQYFSLE